MVKCGKGHFFGTGILAFYGLSKLELRHRFGVLGGNCPIHCSARIIPTNTSNFSTVLFTTLYSLSDEKRIFNHNHDRDISFIPSMYK